MKQKIVIGMQLSSGKCKSKALQIASVADGVTSVAIAGKDKDQVVVIGEGVDAVCLTSSLRKKVGHAELVSVEEVKAKVEEKKKEKEREKEKDEKTPILYPSYCYQYQYPQYYICEPAYNPNPSSCSIM
uniref:HMA domain-containing protein n=2 Tax=Davidia involucrata TaxID=16924 RepID=A0A5B6ZLH3_DAVIN